MFFFRFILINDILFLFTLFLFEGTYKLRKVTLQREGFDIPTIAEKCCEDKLFFSNPKTGTYDTLTVELFHDIMSGKIRV